MSFENQLDKLKEKRVNYKPPVQKVGAVQIPMTVVFLNEYKIALHKEAIKQGVHVRELFVLAVRRKLTKHEKQEYSVTPIKKAKQWRTNYFIDAELNKALHTFKVEHGIFLKQLFNEAVQEYLEALKPKKGKTPFKQVTLEEGIKRESGE